jgi:outer membrane murein-binding lipoprotein Lpp
MSLDPHTMRKISELFARVAELEDRVDQLEQQIANAEGGDE